MTEPRIAIPVVSQDVTNYARALRRAGMIPVLVTWPQGGAGDADHSERVEPDRFDCRRMADGLLLPGGGDICPAWYGEESRGSEQMKPVLDMFQMKVLDDFVKAGKPVLGICRGHQLLNVYFGGTLTQDIPTASSHARQGDNRDKIHSSRTAAGTWLETLYGPVFTHNSSHHQAVKDPGKGLIPDSFSVGDGIIEGQHHMQMRIWSVQWHPERMCLEYANEETVDGLSVFRFFREHI